MNGCWQVWTLIVVGVLAWVYVGIWALVENRARKESETRVAAFYARRRFAARTVKPTQI